MSSNDRACASCLAGGGPRARQPGPSQLPAIPGAAYPPSQQAPGPRGGGGGGGGGAGGTIEPNRAAVQSALRAVGPAVRACGTGSGGVATVTLVFNQQGRVNTANVGAPHAGTPVGSCVARAAREAQIPAFNSRPTLSVTFPYPLQ